MQIKNLSNLLLIFKDPLFFSDNKKKPAVLPFPNFSISNKMLRHFLLRPLPIHRRLAFVPFSTGINVGHFSARATPAAQNAMPTAPMATTAALAAAADGDPPKQQKHQHFLASLPELKQGQGDAVVDFEALDKKVLLLYFSAGWCHTCRDFTPKFKEFYNQTKNDVTILWLSRDKSKEEQQEYYAKSLDPTWLYVPLGKTVRDFLRMYKLYGLPSVKMVDREGNLVEEELKKDIEAGNAEELLQKCKKQLGL